ncbi:Cacna1h [Symbiodinium sp. CCMP2592]|nr:Cacna1h [Symbiodinium sp. CCMP2592]
MPRPNIQKDHLGPEHPHHDHHDHHVHHLHHEPVDHLSHLMARHHASLLERLSEQDEILRDILSRTHHRTSWGGGADEKPRPPRRKSYRSPIKVVEAQTDGKFVSETAHSAHSHIIKSYTAEDAERRDVSSSIHGHTMRRMLGQAATKFSHLAAPARHTKDTCTSCIRKIVESSAFEGFFALVVISNAIFIGVDVQYVIENPGPKPASYRVAQYSYTALFVIELAFRMLAAGRSFCRGDDWMWKVLDVFVVLTSLWEVLVDILQAIYEEQNGLSAIQGLQSVKSFRIIRLTRLVRTMQFIRVFQFVMALRMLVDSIISTLRSLFWALMLLTLVVYVFAVLFATAVNDYKREGTELLLSDQDNYGEAADGTLVQCPSPLSSKQAGTACSSPIPYSPLRPLFQSRSSTLGRASPHLMSERLGKRMVAGKRAGRPGATQGQLLHKRPAERSGMTDTASADQQRPPQSEDLAASRRFWDSLPDPGLKSDIGGSNRLSG